MRFDYLVVAIFSFILWVLVSMFVVSFDSQTPVIHLIGTFVICCLIAVSIFLLAKSSYAETRIRIEDNDRRAQGIYNWLFNIKDNVVRTMKEYTANRDMSYNQLTTKLANDVDLICTLRDLVLLKAYESAMGRVRNNEKEKAVKQIEEVKSAIAEIMRHPAQQRLEISGRLEKTKTNFESMSPNKVEQTKLHARVICLNCGTSVSCPHCNTPIVKGNYRYRQEDLSGYQDFEVNV